MKLFLTIFGVILLTMNCLCQDDIAVVIKDCKFLCDYNNPTISLGDKLIVFNQYEKGSYWVCLTKNGENVVIDTSCFKIILKNTLLKLDSNPVNIVSKACSQWVKNEFKVLNIDYCNIVGRIFKRDLKAFKEYVDLIPQIDTSLFFIHASQTWGIINAFDDWELEPFIANLDNKEKLMFIGYLKDRHVGYPFSKYSEYLSLFYPKTWAILKKNE